MTLSEYRTEARKKLSGKWGKAALITLAYSVISWALSLVAEDLPRLTSIVEIVVGVPLSFGLTKAFVKLYNGEDVGAFDFLKLGFNNFSKSWQIAFSILGKVIIPFVLLVASYFMLVFGSLGFIVLNSTNITSNSVTGSLTAFGIIGLLLILASSIWLTVQSYYYQLSNIIASEDENISHKEAVNKSRELMDGKRGKLFCLQLSFIGWALLCVLTLGIGYFWLSPYIEFATIAFYKFALGKKDNNEITNESEEKDVIQ